jgi:sugar phosphate isomerase/epimerase
MTVAGLSFAFNSLTNSRHFAMKIGLFTDGLRDLAFDAMLDWCAAQGIETVEIGTGNFSDAPHCNLARLLESDAARADFLGAIARRGLRLSALNCSGNLLDPDPERRSKSQRVFRDSVRLAQKLGLDTVVTMSGCPGEPGEPGRYPNWVTCTWQPEFQPLIEWQWKEAVEPFWRETAPFVADYGVRLALEMHPGQAVYNTRTLVRLREVSGGYVGANLDPSHLFWQGMDPLHVIGALGEAIFHVHAKDCWFDRDEMALNGGLETRMTTRAWEHCIPGKGHDENFWRDFVAALKRVGYDRSLSIEYAGPGANARAGIEQTAALLSRVRSAMIEGGR